MSRNVVISDARYTDGAKNSTVYHRLNNNCLRDGKDALRMEVDEDTAQAFGRTYCKVCAEVEWKEALANNLRVIPELDQLLQALPSGFEVRIFFSGKKVWDGTSGAERSEKHVSKKSESSSSQTR